ncbi:MAG TPA: peptide deformylase [Clostridiales bacterium]|jgi:peptide deformylase|nr:peptide deformylase [Clostridiales bacterium]
MAFLNIVTSENEILRKRSREVIMIDERTLRLIDDMKDTLSKSGGVGLAAVQVGVLKRIFLIDMGKNLIVFINPVILETDGEREVLEGCLSCPGQWGYTKRPIKVKAEATNIQGERFVIEGEELLAQAIIHEYNHLEGKLFTDDAIHMLTEKELEEHL